MDLLSNAAKTRNKDLRQQLTFLFLMDNAGRRGMSSLREVPNQSLLIMHRARAGTPSADLNILELVTNGAFTRHEPPCLHRDQEIRTFSALKMDRGGRHTLKQTSATLVFRAIVLLLKFIRIWGHPHIPAITHSEATPKATGIEFKGKIRPTRVCRISLGGRNSFNHRGDSPQTGSSS